MHLALMLKVSVEAAGTFLDVRKTTKENMWYTLYYFCPV
jgi:hypothetical protein